MRITSKGQVTIPHEIRRRAGLLPDLDEAFSAEDGRVILQMPAAQACLAELATAGRQNRASCPACTEGGRKASQLSVCRA